MLPGFNKRSQTSKRVATGHAAKGGLARFHTVNGCARFWP